MTKQQQALAKEIIELEEGIKRALKHLRYASPRNGPIIKAISILEHTLVDKRGTWDDEIENF